MLSASTFLTPNSLSLMIKEANVLLLERMFRSTGYTSITSTMDSNLVWELYRQNRYDLID